MTGLVPRGWSQGMQGDRCGARQPSSLQDPGQEEGPLMSLKGPLNPAAPGGTLTDPST